MQIKEVKLLVGGLTFPLDAEKMPPEIRREVEIFLDKIDPLMETLPVPGLLKGRDIELRIKLKLDRSIKFRG